MNLNYRKITTIIYTPEIVEYIQTELLLLLTMDDWEELIGLVL